MTLDDVWDWLTNDNVIVGLKIAAILLAAIVLTRVLRRAVARVEEKIGRQGTTLRYAQRTRTLTKVLTSAGIVAIWVIALLTALGNIPRFNLAPLLAGLGITGVAIGFGAQNLVRDVVSGFFILLEDQYGIGDIVEINKAATGTVEQLTLRLTGLRDVDGTIHYFANGAITQVSNRSKDWSGAVVDVKFGVDEDLGRVRAVLEQVAARAETDPELAEELLEQPEILGVESFSDSEVVLRFRAETKPGRQFEVSRRLREMIKLALDEAKISVNAS